MSKPSRKVVGSEGRGLIAKVYHFMKNEAENGVMRTTDARWRTSQATGVSERTVTRILKEEKNLPSTDGKFVEPMSKRNMRPTKSKIDDFAAEVIRTTIEEYKAQHKQVPTLRKLKEILAERISYSGCISTLRKILHNLGLECSVSGVPKKKGIKKKFPISMSVENLVIPKLEPESEEKPILIHPSLSEPEFEQKPILIHPSFSESEFEQKPILIQPSLSEPEFEQKPILIQPSLSEPEFEQKPILFDPCFGSE